MKRVLFLGAAASQLPPIRAARDRGYEVLTCDNRPDNPGHRLAHESFMVSTVDRDAVLALATDKRVDGLLTSASDVSAPAVAYVAEALGLPGNPLASVMRLTNKAEFRKFLNDTGLQPLAHAVFDVPREAVDWIRAREGPLILKPVDAAGSKGVSVLTGREDVVRKVAYAFEESLAKRVIVEAFVEKTGYQVCGDGFFEDGRVTFVEFGDGYFHEDRRFMAPYAETFPSRHAPAVLAAAREKIERILVAAGFGKGGFNLDVLITPRGDPFVIELGPRAGGNYIPVAVSLRSGADYVGALVESALDPGFRFSPPAGGAGGYVACYMLHSRQGGVFRGVTFAPEIERHVVEYTPYREPGSEVGPFVKGSEAIGNLVLRFSSREEMYARLESMETLCRIDVERLEKAAH